MQFKEYFAIEKKLVNSGFDFTRSELIQQFTSNRKKGLSELTPFEYKELIRWMNERFSNENQTASKTDEIQRKLQIQRRKIIALFAKMGYVKDDKADMQRIYAWVLKYGYLNKSLNLYTVDEIPKLVYQAEECYASYLKTF